MKEPTLFDGVFDPALICEECGFMKGHAPDCFTEFLPNRVAYYQGSSRDGSIAYEEVGLYQVEGLHTEDVKIPGEIRDFGGYGLSYVYRSRETEVGTIFRFAKKNEK